jgi:hypothetical protein
VVLAAGTVTFFSPVIETARQPEATKTTVVSGESEPDELVRLRAEIAQLRAEVRALAEASRQAVAMQEQQAPKMEPHSVSDVFDEVAEVQQQIENTAFIIVNQADRMYRELGLVEAAVDAYRRAVDLFPRTRSADAARKRLAEIKRMQGDRL